MNRTFRFSLPRFFFLSVFLSLLAGGCGEFSHAPSKTAYMDAVATAQAANPANFVNAHAIIIVRHGDIDPAQKSRLGNQTPLTDRGEQRAQELAFALQDAGITRIITSSALRTQETAAPLAKAFHITPEIPFGHGPETAAATGTGNSSAGRSPGTNAFDSMPKQGQGGDEAKTTFDFLVQTAKPTDTILLVDHHSIIPSLMAEFGFTHEPAFDDATEFDRFYLLLPDAQHHTYQLFRLRYGGIWEKPADRK